MALNLDQIRAAARRVAVSHGMELVDLQYQPGSKPRNLQIFVEKNAEERARLAAEAEAAGEAGDEEGRIPKSVADGLLGIDQLAWVTHEDCETFSRDFGTLLDVEDLMPGAEYTLEVSSPGLDRGLFTHADYVRFRDSLVKIQTFEPVEGNRHWQGRLTEVGETKVVLDLSAIKQKGKAKKKLVAQTVELELANVEKARLIPEI